MAATQQSFEGVQRTPPEMAKYFADKMPPMLVSVLAGNEMGQLSMKQMELAASNLSTRDQLATHVQLQKMQNATSRYSADTSFNASLLSAQANIYASTMTGASLGSLADKDGNVPTAAEIYRFSRDTTTGKPTDWFNKFYVGMRQTGAGSAGKGGVGDKVAMKELGLAQEQEKGYMASVEGLIKTQGKKGGALNADQLHTQLDTLHTSLMDSMLKQTAMHYQASGVEVPPEVLMQVAWQRFQGLAQVVPEQKGLLWGKSRVPTLVSLTDMRNSDGEQATAQEGVLQQQFMQRAALQGLVVRGGTSAQAGGGNQDAVRQAFGLPVGGGGAGVPVGPMSQAPAPMQSEAPARKQVGTYRQGRPIWEVVEDVAGVTSKNAYGRTVTGNPSKTVRRYTGDLPVRPNAVGGVGRRF